MTLFEPLFAALEAAEIRDPAETRKALEVLTGQGFESRLPVAATDFADHPIPFADLWASSEVVELPTTRVRIASIDHLIELKRLAGRPKDLADIEKLEEIRRRRREER